MPYLSAKAIEQARHTDLLSWLQYNEPGNLVKLAGDSYCTKEHDSLKISNGKWHWFSRGIGGVSALDYLIKVKEYSFPQAVEAIVDGAAMKMPPFTYAPKEQKLKRLLMPEMVPNPENAKAYLEGRGISPVILEYCIRHSLLFETANFNNAVFVGYDPSGIPRCASIRGTRSAYKSEVTGSDKHYSFSIAEQADATEVHIFESAIDLLSFATLELLEGRDWKQQALLSLAGVFQTTRKNVVPVGLSRFLEDHPKISTIHLHLDNDEVGRGAAQGILNGLPDRYQVFDEPPAQGKDVNEELMLRVGNRKNKEEFER